MNSYEALKRLLHSTSANDALSAAAELFSGICAAREHELAPEVMFGNSTDPEESLWNDFDHPPGGNRASDYIGECCGSFTQLQVPHGEKWMTVGGNFRVELALQGVIDWVLRNPTWAKYDHKIGKKGTTLNFYCKLSGSIEKQMARYNGAPEEGRSKLLTKGFGRIGLSGYEPCRAKLRIRFNSGVIERIQVSRGHSHEEIVYPCFRPRLILLDPYLGLYNLICRIAVENRDYDASKILAEALSTIFMVPRSSERRNEYQGLIGVLRTSHMADVSELARALRGYKNHMDLESLSEKKAAHDTL